MPTKLSPEMQRAYDMAKANGDVLCRHAGGFWAPQGWKLTPGTMDKDWVSTHTIKALVKRGAAIYSDHKRDRSGVEFAVAITIKAI